MTTPTKITNHAAQARERLATQFRKTVSHAGVLNALGRQVQELEDAFFELLTLMVIASSSGLQLDALGKLLGCPRGNLTDAQFKIYLRGQILLNRSGGTVPQLRALLSTVLSAHNSNLIEGRAYQPAALILWLHNAIGDADPNVLALLLKRARVAGVRGILEWSPADDSGTILMAEPDGDGNGPSIPAQGMSGPAVLGSSSHSGRTFTTTDDLVARGFPATGSVFIENTSIGAFGVFSYTERTTTTLTGLSPAMPLSWTMQLYAMPAGGGVLAGAKDG